MHEGTVGPSPGYPADLDGGERPGKRAAQASSGEGHQTPETAGWIERCLW